MHHTVHSIVTVLGQLGQVWPDAPSVQAALGCPWSAQHRRSWRALLRQAYSRETLTVGYAIFGRNLELADLGRIAPYTREFAARAQEAPALAPLLGAFAKVGVAPPQDYAAIRQGALARGLRPAAWKWLCHQSAASVRKLFAFGWTHEAVFWANLLAASRPHLPLSEAWLEPGRPFQTGLLYEQLTNCASAELQATRTLQLERLIRLVPATPSAQALAELETLTAELHLGHIDPEAGLTVQRNSTWRGLLERHRRKMDGRLALANEVAKAKGAKEQTWDALFGQFQFGGVTVAELTSNFELVREGVLLSHCVGDGQYLSGCLSGAHVIASVVAPSAQRATLQLRRNPANGQFTIGQLAGQGNSRVPQMFWTAARKLQAQLNS